MVTSTKIPEKKVVSMAEPNDTGVVPQRTLLGEVNEHITCPLCRGYYIDATTIVECLHSFCRSCIIKHLQVKKYCPVCEMMINSAKPNIKLDKALQDIVYKLVPGLFQKEMERRQQFYASRPGPAASATPEQRGEDTERIIFSPEDVISFSLEFADVTDADSTSSKSSDSNESQLSSVANRRYLQCPAVVNINHLKKFLSMKFDIDSTLFAIEILYKRVPLPDYYTLMDIAYIYNWKRNEPMRFIYKIIDYVAIRNRLFDNRKDTQFRDRKTSPASTEDTNASSPAPHLHDPCSEASSGTDSPMPDDSKGKHNDSSRKHDTGNKHKDVVPQDGTSVSKSNVSGTSSKKNEDDVEKSQFLNSFELTATNSCPSGKSPIKSNQSETSTSGTVTKTYPHKTEETAKRKMLIPSGTPELKKLKVEIEKAIFPLGMNIPQDSASTTTRQVNKSETCDKAKDSMAKQLSLQINSPVSITGGSQSKDAKQLTTGSKSVPSETPGFKRNIAGPPKLSSPKRSKPSDIQTSVTPSTTPSVQKTVSPLKLQLPKLESHTSNTKTDLQKAHTKKMPDLKPSSLSQMPQSRGHVNRLRMDLLANNSDPTIDRSKILSQVKSSLSVPNTPASGDPIKSLFDSCKINIPSSLSITLTDQKLDSRSVSEPAITDQKKTVNVPATSNNPPHKVPSHPVRNSIEILKLTDSDPKKQNKSDGSIESKTNSSSKGDTIPQQSKPPNKSESSAKGPVPNLKPISDTKLAKQSGNFAGPITFQQTFEQQLRSVQTDKKSKLPKNKTQVPKLVPATPKNLSAANKLNSSPKPSPGGTLPLESKPSTALDLSTPHPIQSQLNPQQTKAFETMQSIANLAKKQNPPSKGLPLNIPQSNVFSNVPNIPMSTVPSPLRIPTTTNINQIKLDKVLPSNSQANRQDVNKVNPQQIKPASSASPSIPSPGYQIPSLTHNSPNSMQPSPRSTRSPSSSPKLVIAEEKHTNSSDHNTNQSNQISSTQMSSMNVAKSESPKPSPGPSKSGLKPIKSLSNLGKPIGIRQPITSTMKSNPALSSPADYLTQPQLIAHHALFRQIDMQNAWLAQRQYDLYKNIAAHQNQNDFNKNKDNKQ